MYSPEEPSAPTPATCPAPLREAAKLQELFVKLDKALNKLSRTSVKLLTVPKL
jgi:hypothetical protein